MVLRRLELFGSTRTRVRRPATARTTAARSTAPGRTSEPDVAALRVWRAAAPLARLPSHQVRAAGRTVGALDEAVGSGDRARREEGTAPASAVRLVRRSRMDPASHVSVRAAPAVDRARKASRDPHRGWETCQQRYLGGVPARRRGFSTRGAWTEHTGRDLPRFFPRQQTERLPRCQFAPRMLHRARRLRFPPVSSETSASRDAEAWPFWP